MKPKYLKNWQQRFEKQKFDNKKRAKLARVAVKDAIDILKQYGATKIILFGSLLNDEEKFRANSDIDLAVEGIAIDHFCRAYADLIMALNWPVDLKPFDELENGFKENIVRQGKILYENKTKHTRTHS